jgi:broad specificity phosphatase PhoE
VTGERRLTLVRHGRSSYVHPGGWLNRVGMLEWRLGYDASGIVDHDAPPASLLALAHDADLVVASDLPRAIMTAERLADGRRITLSPLLREAPAELPHWKRVRMPRALWELAVKVHWGIRIVRHTDIPPRDLERATKAAVWLDGLTSRHRHVVVVTHGVFRRILARQLEALGWHPDGRRRSYAHWSIWSLTAD